MRLSLDLSLPVLSALFAGGFPGPVDSHGQGFLVDRVIGAIGNEVPHLKPVQWDEIGNPVPVWDATIDLSIPWVHEHVAATCLRLLGVPNVRAACMATCDTMHVLRWVDALDGLPRTASWYGREGWGPGSPSLQRQNDLAGHIGAANVLDLVLKPNATHNEALAALMIAIDVDKRRAG